MKSIAAKTTASVAQLSLPETGDIAAMPEPKRGELPPRKGAVCQAEDRRPYHTDSKEYPPKHRKVYHDHEYCPDGKLIKAEHRHGGTGGKPRCKECIKLD